MPLVYIDRDQCHYFGIDYFQKDRRFICAADTLLASKKGDGYDAETVTLLKPLGGKTLILDAAPDEGPGWFTVTGWLSGFRQVTSLDGIVSPL